MRKAPKKTRVRFAPAPTGALHIGGARTALFNYLFAKKEEGTFVLRIEDTDKERSRPEYEQGIIEGLRWLGIDWDEQYRQSERIDIYKEYLKKLVAGRKAYFCFCSSDELEMQRQEQLSRGLPPRYSGKCAGLSKKEQQDLTEQGSGSVIRFRMPVKKVIFQDLVRGKIEFDTGLTGDIVIAKNFEQPLYNFAAVIDDFEMKIDCIIRGEDHLSNTPKQILLQESLCLPKPKYAHLPLILGPDRSKLSKRHGAVAVDGYREQGYLPEAIINFIALLGWNPGTKKEIFSVSELIKEFSLQKVQKSGAVFNPEKLNYLNGFYIRHKNIENLTELCIPYLTKDGLIKELNTGVRLKAKSFSVRETEEIIEGSYLEKIVAIYQERLKKLSEISELTDFFFKIKLRYDKELLRWKGMSDGELRLVLDKLENILSGMHTDSFRKENLEKFLIPEAEKFTQEISGAGDLSAQALAKADRGYLLWPLRVALTGKKASAAPFETAELLGKKKTLERLKQAKSLAALP